MVVGTSLEINANNIRFRNRSLTLADLSKHYQQRELGDGNSRIAHSTKKAYAGYLQKWIQPRWGRYALSDIRAIEVEVLAEKPQPRARNALQDTKPNESVIQSRPSLRSL
jgi:hypothetical protein